MISLINTIVDPIASVPLDLPVKIYSTVPFPGKMAGNLFGDACLSLVRAFG